MASRQLQGCTSRTPDGSATFAAAGVGATGAILIYFDDAEPVANVMASIDRAEELIIRDIADRAVS